jgi:hypothetical protein
MRAMSHVGQLVRSTSGNETADISVNMTAAMGRKNLAGLGVALIPSRTPSICGGPVPTPSR